MKLSDLGDNISEKETLKLITVEKDVIEQGVIQPEPIVKLYCRDEDGERRTIEVTDFYPYFYISNEEYEEREDEISRDNRIRRVEKNAANSLKTSRNLTRVYTMKPYHVGEARDDYDETWEADVFFKNRFLIDSGIKTTFEIPKGKDKISFNQIYQSDKTLEVSPRIVYVDIEVISDNEMPDPKYAEKPINAITAYDSYDGVYLTWVLESEEWEESPDFGEHVYTCDDERELLNRFNNWMGNREIDILTGWNSSDNDIGSGFDFPYLISRCESINVLNTDKWSPEGKVFTNDYDSANVSGVELVDMLQAYKKTQVHDLDKKTLDFVANKELGYGKEEMEDIDEAYYEEPETFVKYNRRDVEAVVEIDREAEVIDLYESLREVTGAKFSDCHNNIDMMDIYFLRNAKKSGKALPTSREPDEDWYHGAFVYQPEPGKHDNVLYPDLACFTEGHKALTPEGIKKIENLEIGDEIYTLNEDTHEIVKDEVIDTHNYEYSGKIHKNTSKDIQYEITPNHNIYTHDSGSKDRATNFSKKQVSKCRKTHSYIPKHEGYVCGDNPEKVDITENIDDIYAVVYYEGDGRKIRHELPEEIKKCYEKCIGSEEGVSATRSQGRSKKYYIPIEKYRKYEEELKNIGYKVTFKKSKTCENRKSEYDLNNIMTIVAWYITEGSVGNKNPNRISIANEEEKILNYIENVVNDMGMSAYKNSRKISFNNGIMAKWLKKKCGSGSYNKRIPEFIFETEISHRRAFLEELIRGDGIRNSKTNAVYYTSSEELKDDVCRLALSVGLKPSVYKRRNSEYDIKINNKNGSICRKNNEEIIDYNGNVYCITAKENHVIYAGKDGYMNWIGQSLYPYIMKTINVSPDTIIGTKEELEKSDYTEDDCCKGYIDDRPIKYVSSEENKDKYKDGKYKAIVNKNTGNVHWSDDPKNKEIYYLKESVKEGFITSAIDELVELKYKYEGKKYEAVKRVTNSVYGILGDASSYNKGFRLYDSNLAESVTLSGRKVLKFTGKKFVESMENQGYDDAYLAYGDSDSVITSMPSAETTTEALLAGRKAAEYTKDAYDDFMKEEFDVDEHLMDVEIESYASGILFSRKSNDLENTEEAAKKRYAQLIEWDEDEGFLGYDPDPEPKIKGFDAIRSDTSKIVKEAQKKVISIILQSDNPKEDTYDYLEQLIDEVKEGEWDAELGIPKSINQELSQYGKNGHRCVPQIRGAKYVNQNFDGVNIEKGDSPMVYMVRGVPDGYEKVYEADTGEDGMPVDAIAVNEASEIPDGFEIDYDTMLEKTLKSSLEPILRTMEWSWSDVKGRGRQQGLGSFA